MNTDNFLNLDPECFPLDRYLPVSELGKGSAGIVYLCQDRLLDKLVAIKCLRTVTAEQLMGFQAEAKSTSLMKHVATVAVLDFGVTSSGAPYMVMEYADGKTLEQRLKDDGPLPAQLAIKIFLRITEVLEYAHSKGIFHRDIKSSNILILDESATNLDVRLIDFGVARLKHAIQASTLVQGTTIVGTPAYMPPDQAAGLPYDVQSEIYALGCTMFEGLTGQTPFAGETALETIAMHAHEKVPALSDVRGDIFFSEDLESIVQICLEKEKGDRFASMGDLANALSTLDSGRSPSDNFSPGRVNSSIQDPGYKPRGKLRKLAVFALILAACITPASIVYMVIQPIEEKKADDKVKSIFPEYSGLPSNSGWALNPKSTELTDRAWKLLESNLTKEAQSLCTEALIIDKHNLRALDIRGVAKLMEGKFTGARDDLTKSIVRRGMSGREDPGTFFHRALVFRALGDTNSSRLDFREARVLGGYTPERWEMKRFSGIMSDWPPVRESENNSFARGVEHIRDDYKIIDGNDDDLTTLFEPQNPTAKKLYFKGGSYSGAYLAKVADLPFLQSLEFVNVQIYDRDFKFLNKCKNLVKFELGNCGRISGSCLKYTDGLQNLCFIQFKGGKLEDENFKYLNKLHCLKVISIQGCKHFTGAGLAYLPDTIERIDWLSSWDKLTEAKPIDYSQEVFERLAKFRNLDTLMLSSDSMSDTAYSAVSGLKRLRSLIFVGVKAILPKSIDALKTMPYLEKLEFREMAIDPDVIEKIGLCKKVKALAFTNCGIDRDAMRTLVGLPLGLKRLMLEEPKLDRETLLQLQQMKTLNLLILRELPIEIGASTISKLRHAMPNCRIEVKFEDGRVIDVSGANEMLGPKAPEL